MEDARIGVGFRVSCVVSLHDDVNDSNPPPKSDCLRIEEVAFRFAFRSRRISRNAAAISVTAGRLRASGAHPFSTSRFKRVTTSRCVSVWVFSPEVSPPPPTGLYPGRASSIPHRSTICVGVLPHQGIFPETVSYAVTLQEKTSHFCKNSPLFAHSIRPPKNPPPPRTARGRSSARCRWWC